MKFYRTRRECENCLHEALYMVPFSVAFEPYHSKKNTISGYIIDGSKTPLECENCGLARLQ